MWTIKTGGLGLKLRELNFNVGIGTTAPSTLLSIKSSSGGAVQTITGAGTAGAGATINFVGRNDVGTADVTSLIGSAGTSVFDGMWLGATSNHGIRFLANNTEYMRLTNTGNVGIGTTGPGYKLHVAGDVGATAFYYTSDQMLKTNIMTTGGLDIITKLRGVSFDWKDTGKKGIGLVAQDVEKVIPEVVITNPNDGLKALNYGSLAGPMVEAIKELNEEVSDLKAENEALKARIEALEARCN